MKRPLPVTALQFMLHLEAARAVPQWSVSRRIFWLRTDEEQCATVEECGAALWICLRAPGELGYAYEFRFARLHESYPRWTWTQQLCEKSWRRAEHFALLDELNTLFPPELYGVQRVRA